MNPAIPVGTVQIPTIKVKSDYPDLRMFSIYRKKVKTVNTTVRKVFDIGSCNSSFKCAMNLFCKLFAQDLQHWSSFGYLFETCTS